MSLLKCIKARRICWTSGRGVIHEFLGTNSKTNLSKTTNADDVTRTFSRLVKRRNQISNLTNRPKTFLNSLSIQSFLFRCIRNLISQPKITISEQQSILRFNKFSKLRRSFWPHVLRMRRKDDCSKNSPNARSVESRPSATRRPWLNALSCMWSRRKYLWGNVFGV